MRLRIAGLLALLALASGCGSQASTTRIQIRVHAFGGHAWTYELRCDPAGGTVPRPEHACRLLSRHRNLLASGDVGFDHSCPAGGFWIEVVGKRLGHDLSVVFPDSRCDWVPAQGTGETQWLGLVGYKLGHKQSHGRPSSDQPLQSAADRRRGDELRRALRRREDALRAQLRALTRRRSSVIAHRGLLAAEPLTLQLLRQDALAATTGGGYLHPTGGRAFRTTHRKAALVLQSAGVIDDKPVYALVVPVGSGALTIIYDARTLQVTDWGIGPHPPRTTALGQGIALFTGP